MILRAQVLWNVDDLEKIYKPEDNLLLVNVIIYPDGGFQCMNLGEFQE